MIAKTACIAVGGAAIIYKLTNNILKNNSVDRLYFKLTRIMLFSYGYIRQ